MLNLPWWLKLILHLGIKFGLPKAVKGVSPQILLLLENLIAQVAASPSEEHAIAHLASVGQAVIGSLPQGTQKA